MKERPILFSAPMVRALLAGRKTQTRRVIKLPAALAVGDLSRAWPDKMFGVTPGLHVPMPDESVQRLRNPWDWPEPSRLWVRESWRTYASLDHLKPRNIRSGPGVQYEAKGTNLPGDTGDYLLGMGKLRPGIFMPRWGSRITLEITGVRVERLQEISEDDALAEGIERVGGDTSCSPWRNYRIGERGEMQMHCSAPSRSYMTLWESINGHNSWDANPWVWVVEFRSLKPS